MDYRKLDNCLQGGYWGRVLRHFERGEDYIVLFDLVVVSNNKGPEPVKLSVTENGMTMTLFEDEGPAGRLYRTQ